MTTPIYITSFNRLAWLRAMVFELERMPGARPIVVDNASTYPPLVDWLSHKCPVEVIRLPENRGPRAAWSVLDDSARFVVTDPDLDLSGCPADLLEILHRGLDEHDDIHKVGPSIRIHDIPPEFPFFDHIQTSEGPFWQKKRGWWYEALIDTTFALYRPRPRSAANYGPALRAPAPYQVRHLPYYYVSGSLTAEDVHYIRTLPSTFKSGLYWSTLMADNPQLLGIDS
ncbi:hypothetical protein BH11PLA2_BH11PLA2_34660 [soil metagenome]